jgi:hypothetical protein
MEREKPARLQINHLKKLLREEQLDNQALRSKIGLLQELLDKQSGVVNTINEHIDPGAIHWERQRRDARRHHEKRS